MNKIMMLPLMIMFSLTLLGYLSGGTLGTDDIGIGDVANITYNETSMDVPTMDPVNINVWDISTGGGLAVLILAISTGIVAGIGLFGSGLSVVSQTLIFKLIGLVGLWGVFTITGGQFILTDTGAVGIGIYLALTMMFALGFIIDFRSGD